MSDGDSPDEDGRPDEEPPSDPFDRLGPGTDRDGDPFERLDGGQSAESDPHAPSEDDVWAPPSSDRHDDGPGDDGSDGDGSGDGWTETGPTDQPSRGPNASGAETGTGGPFEHVETPSESPFDGDGSAFERVDTGGADPDRVWESITDGDDADDPAVPDDGRYTDVSKHRFCERCEHFSPPPEVSCGHHAAEIIEFLDVETVRLLDCPVVAERDALERRD